ncbi:MAG: diguanylate cyclase [Parahaliea sp.]
MSLPPTTIRLRWAVTVWLVLCYSLPLADESRQQSSSDAVELDAVSVLEGCDLASGWRFAPGDDPARARPGYDDSQWQRVTLPHRWDRVGEHDDRHVSWYRLHIRFKPGEVAELGSLLGLRLGPVLSAYEVYAGGKLLGGVGQLPPVPNPSVDYDYRGGFSLPLSAIDERGELVLALRVWGGGDILMDRWSSGPYRGLPRIGTYDGILNAMIIQQLPGLLISSICLMFGLYHLYIFNRDRQLTSFFWFALGALVVGAYGLLINQWRYLLGWDFQDYKKLEYVAIYLMPPLFIQAVWTLVDRPIGRLLRCYQLSFVVVGLAWVMTPGLDIHWSTQRLWQMWTLPALALVGWRILRSATGSGTDLEHARTIALGGMLFIAACVHDLAVDHFLLSSPRLLSWGFLLFMLSMAMCLANQMTAALGRLEQEVAERTLDLRKVNRRLAETARIEPLTGLFNRRGFVEEAEAEIQRVFRTGRTFTLILADIDHFKSFNDRYGHACGDYVLSRVASRLADSVRDVDRVARWGGEEFILMLPETNVAGAAVLAAKLRECVAENVLEYSGERLRVTMTFGVSEFQRGESLDNCIARADTALYRGKEEGRDRVVVGRASKTLVT